MIKEAEHFAQQDKKVKDQIDTRNEFESFVFDLTIISLSLYLSVYRYVYSIRNQLTDKTKPLGRLSSREQTAIEYHVDKQIQWLDQTSDAKLEDIIKHKNQFEEIILDIIDEINKRGPNSNDTYSSSHSNAGEL